MNAALLALLFVPDPATLDWAAFEAAVSSAPAPFTVALAAEEVPPGRRAWLKDAAAAGRLELALRLPRDPLLPALVAAAPDAAAEGLAASRALFRAAFGVEPAGFVSGAGLHDAGSLAALAAQGFAWTAAGTGAYARPWRAAERLHAVPAEPATDLASLSSALAAGPRTTLAAALAASEPFGVAPATWPAWASASSWLASPETARRAARLALAAEALERYQASGRAGADRLEKGAEALRAAASARLLDPASDEGPFRAAVLEVYKAAGERPPGPDGAEGAPVAAVLARGVEFTNAEASTAPWRPRLLRVERDGKSLTVTVEAPAAASLALYVDLNGLAGSGSTGLLEGRREALRGRDAWEFAALAGPGGGTLWRTRTPEPVEDFPVTAADGRWTFSLPGTRLRGSPSAWGFLLLTFPEDGDAPPGLLGTAEDQRRLGGEGPPPVLKAVRLLER